MADETVETLAPVETQRPVDKQSGEVAWLKVFRIVLVAVAALALAATFGLIILAGVKYSHFLAISDELQQIRDFDFIGTLGSSYGPISSPDQKQVALTAAQAKATAELASLTGVLVTTLSACAMFLAVAFVFLVARIEDHVRQMRELGMRMTSDS